MSLDTLLVVASGGLVLGAIYALMAAGLAMDELQQVHVVVAKKRCVL